MPSFNIVPERISRHPKYKFLKKIFRIYQFFSSIVALVLFAAYLISLANTLTTAHGIVLTIAICSFIYTAISTALIFFTSYGGDVVDAVRWVFDLIFVIGWGTSTGILGVESSSCGGGDNNTKKRNDSDSDGGCGVLGAAVAASALSLIGFLLCAVMNDATDASKLKNPLKDEDDDSEQQNKGIRLSRGGGYEAVHA